MIVQWENECISPSNLSVTRPLQTISGEFPWLITFCQSVATHTAENGPITSQCHQTTCGHRGGRPKSNQGLAMCTNNEKIIPDN